MILDSLKIMFIGMGTVFLFLVLLVGAINGISKLIGPYIHHLEKEIDLTAKKQEPACGVSDTLLSVIASSIYTFRMRRAIINGKEKD